MPLQDTDNLIVGRGDTPYKITYEKLKEKLEEDGLGSITNIDPSPGDGNNTVNPTPSGSGTFDDPYVFITSTVAADGISQSVETISFTNQTEGSLVKFEDLNAVGNGSRFDQPLGLIDANGTWSGKLVFKDIPTTPTNTSYTGLLKIGSVHYSWSVSVTVEPDVEIKQPEVLTPAPGAGIGGDVTYTPETSAIITDGVEEISDTISAELWSKGLYDDKNFSSNSNIVKLDKAFDGSLSTRAISSVTGVDQTIAWKTRTFNNLWSIRPNARIKIVTWLSVERDVEYEVTLVGDGASDEVYTRASNPDNFYAEELVSADGTSKEVQVFDTLVEKNWSQSGSSFLGIELKIKSLNMNATIGAVYVDGLLLIDNEDSVKSQTTLTFTDDKAYDSADGTEMTTIDQAFKAGDRVVGKGTQDQGFAAYVATETACFATDVYTGNGGTLTRNTGIDNTKALVWIKEKEGDGNHVLFDTDRGVGNALNSDRGNKQNYDAEYLQAFNDNGFTLGNHRLLNYPGSKFVAWNFRAAPGFMDIITYTGDGINDKR